MLKNFNRIISLMLLLSFVLMFQVPAMATPAVKNLIPAALDPNFDNGTKIGTQHKVNNVYLGAAEAEFGYDETNKCIRIKSTVTTATGKWNNLTLRGFTFEEGKSYIVAYDAKIDNPSTSGVNCSVELNGTNYATILPTVKNASKTVQSDWTRVSKMFNCTQTTSSINVVFRFMSNVETMLIDNLAVYEINNDANNLLNSNYSFEFNAPAINNTFEVPSGVAELYNDGFDGEYCLRISTGTTANGKLSKLFRFAGLSVTGGAMYELSAYVKLADSNAEGVTAYMTAQHEGTNTPPTTGEIVGANTRNQTPINANEWTKVTRIYPANAFDNKKLHVGIGLEGLPAEGCDVLVDNVVVKMIAEPAAVEGVGSTIGKLAEYENKIAVSVTPAESKSVWMVIAKYNGSEMQNVELKEVDITSAGQTIGYTFADVAEKESSVVYVWEKGTLTPILHRIDFKVAD